MTHPTRLLTLILCALPMLPATAPAAALDNLEFAAQVRAWRAQMQRSDQPVADAALVCAYLPAHRAVEEPRCVALRGHLRARLARTTPADAAPAADPSLLDHLSGWLGRVLPQG